MHLQCSLVIQLLFVICVCGVFTWEFGNLCSIKVVAHENLIQGLKIAWKLYLHVHVTLENCIYMYIMLESLWNCCLSLIENVIRTFIGRIHLLKVKIEFQKKMDLHIHAGCWKSLNSLFFSLVTASNKFLRLFLVNHLTQIEKTISDSFIYGIGKEWYTGFVFT